jgi:peptide-methionine (S)-S-oxide reductase
MAGMKFRRLPTKEEALPGRNQVMPVPERHLVLDTPLRGPWAEGTRLAIFGMGCFWGAEKFLWKTPGVYSTFVGYSGGQTPNPAYEEVCSEMTGHAEVAVAVYQPEKVDYDDLLKVFWENHDPTQYMRQGNDVGTQYRSVIYTTGEDQQEAAEKSLERYQAALTDAGFGKIVTEIVPAGPVFYAEPYHQQYLARYPWGYCNHGFCQAAYPGAKALAAAEGAGS